MARGHSMPDKVFSLDALIGIGLETVSSIGGCQVRSDTSLYHLFADCADLTSDTDTLIRTLAVVARRHTFLRVETVRLADVGEAEVLLFDEDEQLVTRIDLEYAKYVTDVLAADALGPDDLRPYVEKRMRELALMPESLSGSKSEGV